jgi:hypothetical protein
MERFLVGFGLGELECVGFGTFLSEILWDLERWSNI